MHKRMSFLEKKSASIVVIVFGGGIRMIVLSNGGPRRKMLRETDYYMAKIGMATKTWSIDYAFETIRRWWESIDEEELLQQLINSPKDSKPIIFFDKKMMINFNVKRGQLFEKVVIEEILSADD